MANLLSVRKIVKIPSAKLSEPKSKWALRVSVQDLQAQNQIVNISSSHVTRFLDEISQNGFSEERVREVKSEIKELMKQENSGETRKRLKDLKHELFKLQYIPHIVSVNISKFKHYDSLNNGFSITLYDEYTGEIISDVKYVRLLSTSASIKKNEVFYVDERYKERIVENLECGYNKESKFVPAKLSAYMALAMSSSNPVRNTYNVCVVNDYEHKIITPVLELDDSIQEEPVIRQIDDYEMDINCNDGFGFIDPDFAEKWAEDLHLDYTPSAFITRHAFCKGVLARFPYKEFARENGITTITDVWGKVWDVEEVDIVLTTSMLKLSGSYESWDDYFTKATSHHYTFSITKQTPKTLDMERTTNYQFIQGLDWTDEDIKGFLQPTLDEITDVMGGDYRKALVYLRGMSLNEDSDVLRDDYTTALMINPLLINDSYVQTSIRNMIKKRIDDCKKGTIKVRGNFQTTIGDPMLLAQHMFGLPVTGLLKANEFYSNFWNELGVDYVIGFRAPQVSYNNISRMSLKNTDEMKKWYRYLGEIFILNGFDATMSRLSGADFDGDTIFTTDNPYIIKGAQREALPVVCLQKSAQKVQCTEQDFILSDKLMLEGKIENVGVITNRATAIESYKSNFEYGSKEWLELDYRVRACISLSQNSIDAAKGIKIEYGFPKSWIQNKPNTVKDGDSQEVKEHKEFYNSIVADKKPYFFIYIYDGVKKEYSKLLRDENKRCLRKFGRTLEEIMENPTSVEEEDTIRYYKQKCPIDKSPGIVNKIAWYVEDYFKGLRFEKLKSDEYVSLIKTERDYDLESFEACLPVYKQYLNEVKRMNSTLAVARAEYGEKTEARSSAMEAVKDVLNGISNDEEELCNIVIDMCYKEIKTSKHFAWSMCGNQIINNLLEKNGGYVEYPIMVDNKSDDYDFMYKGYKFKMFRKGVM